MEACPSTVTEDQRRPGLDRVKVSVADYFLKTEGTFQSPRSRKQEGYFQIYEDVPIWTSCFT